MLLHLYAVEFMVWFAPSWPSASQEGTRKSVILTPQEQQQVTVVFNRLSGTLLTLINIEVHRRL
jgi:hypothetical protein